MTRQTNEDTIRKIASTYPPEEIIAAALVAMCVVMPSLEPNKAADLALATLEGLLKIDPDRFFRATHTEQ